MRAARLLAVAALLATGAVGCGDDPEPRSAPTSTRAPSQGESESPTPEPPAAPAPEWRPVDGPTSDDVTIGGGWTLTHRATEAALDGPRPTTIEAPPRHRITHALLDEQYAVVVAEDERAQRPDTATVVDLATGDETTIDSDADVPTTTGGTWALGEGQLVHATVEGKAYCLAVVDLATGAGEVRWCAPDRHGFSDARVTPDGIALMTFDDQRPSCRTVARLDGDELAPFDGPPDCTGWDGLIVDGAAVWTDVPDARRVEEAVLHATTPDGSTEIGPVTSGTLTWCAGAAYAVRDPQRSSDPARLVRWTPAEGEQVVYETEATGRAFLSAPRCGGDALTITAYADSGDEQVTTALP